MFPGTTVVMNHPDGYATACGAGGEFAGWIPNGIPGVIYVLTPDGQRAVVHFDGKLIATVELGFLRPDASAAVISPVA